MRTVLITIILYFSLGLALHSFTGCAVQKPVQKEVKKAERLPAQWWIPTIKRIDKEFNTVNSNHLYMTLSIMLTMREENIWVEDDLHFFLFELRKTMQAEEDEVEKAALKKLYDEFIDFQKERRLERQNAKRTQR